MRRAILTLAALVLAVPPLAIAAPPANFSGDWKLNIERSNFGGMPAPSSASQKVTHEEQSLKIVSQQSGSFGDMSTDLAFTTDGKECENKVMDMVIKSTLKWDGPVLVVDSTMDLQGTPMTMTDRWSLSPDGRELIVDRHVSGPMGSGDGKMIFEKQ
jgi:hypothetical protein